MALKWPHPRFVTLGVTLDFRNFGRTVATVFESSLFCSSRFNVYISSTFHFSGNVPSSKDKLNNLHNEGEISLAHACNNLLGIPREALLTSSVWSCLRMLLGITRTSDNLPLTL